jgi:hypothetical protein
MGTVPTGHELPLADAAPPPCLTHMAAPPWEAIGGPRWGHTHELHVAPVRNPLASGDRTWGRRRTTAVVEPLAPVCRPVVAPFFSVRTSIRPSNPQFCGEERKGGGATEPTQLAGCRGRLPHRAGERLASPPWESEVSGRE